MADHNQACNFFQEGNENITGILLRSQKHFKADQLAKDGAGLQFCGPNEDRNHRYILLCKYDEEQLSEIYIEWTLLHAVTL